MRHALGLTLLAVLAAGTVLAQETQPVPAAGPAETTTVDQVLEKWVLATGGKAAIEKVTTQYAKGTFDLPAMGSNGTWERHAKAPNKLITVVDIPGFGVMKDGHDGTVGWEENPMSGLSEKSGDTLALAKRDAELYRELKFKELYPSIILQGKEKVGARDAWILEAKPAQGAAEKYYFDAETGQLVRHDAQRPGPQGMTPMQMYFEDYKEVDGVKFPFTIRQTGPGFELFLKTIEVKNNIPVEDSQFAKPKTGSDQVK